VSRPCLSPRRNLPDCTCLAMNGSLAAQRCTVMDVEVANPYNIYLSMFTDERPHSLQSLFTQASHHSSTPLRSKTPDLNSIDNVWNRCLWRILLHLPMHVRPCGGRPQPSIHVLLPEREMRGMPRKTLLCPSHDSTDH
jgi:hypothetical protein